jgi:hypothetical protein
MFADYVENTLLSLAYSIMKDVIANLNSVNTHAKDEVEMEISAYINTKIVQEQKTSYLSLINSTIAGVMKTLKRKGVNYSWLLIELFGESSNIMQDVVLAYSNLDTTPAASTTADSAMCDDTMGIPRILILSVHERVVDTFTTIVKAYGDKSVLGWYMKVKNDELINFQAHDSLLAQLGSF